MDYISTLVDLILSNLDRMFYSIITVFVVYVFYRILVQQIRILEANERLKQHFAHIFIRVVGWISITVAIAAILEQWGVELGVITGLLAVSGGTIIGFAAVNTLGNAVAGLIVMTSRPFDVGDRIFFNGRFVDVVSVELIYTKMITLDNVLVSVPNQELLKSQIDDYGKKKTIRRHVKVTPGFEYDVELVEKALLEAAGRVQGILKGPKPYVWITGFHDYAVEYTLYAFINDVKHTPELDAELHRSVLETCKKYEIDISTPLLLRQLADTN